MPRLSGRLRPPARPRAARSGRPLRGRWSTRRAPLPRLRRESPTWCAPALITARARRSCRDCACGAPRPRPPTPRAAPGPSLCAAAPFACGCGPSGRAWCSRLRRSPRRCAPASRRLRATRSVAAPPRQRYNSVADSERPGPSCAAAPPSARRRPLRCLRHLALRDPPPDRAACAGAAHPVAGSRSSPATAWRYSRRLARQKRRSRPAAFR